MRTPELIRKEINLEKRSVEKLFTLWKKTKKQYKKMRK